MKRSTIRAIPVLAALGVVSLVAAGCARGPEFPPRSPIPTGCYADCPIRGPSEQEDSLRLPQPNGTRASLPVRPIA